MPVQVGVGLSVSLFPLGRIGVTGATPGDPDAPETFRLLVEAGTDALLVAAGGDALAWSAGDG
ncbi:MAG: hypothetical protein OXI03_09195 [Chloroflexota bacterium]|nr:hypothetical protein [Chloroflexota bacterium]MYA87748.1 hypothetical protein [Boseongicola sp. SB0662_bin_57]